MRTRSSEGPSSGAVISLALVILGGLAIIVVLAGQLRGDGGGPLEALELTVELETVVDGLDAPVLLAGDGSGGRYVVEQDGRILLLAADGTTASEPFLDIRDRVLHQHERGLLGLAFHPDYEADGRIFVTYSRSPDGATVISEFGRPEDEGQREDTERPLLTIPQPYKTHKGGMLAFDRDGMLLASLGDGGHMDDPFGNGQDRASLLGKLLRIDIDRGWPYATPSDNGFAGDPEARAEIHAIGLRNPWRFSVDRAGGHVYIADVGQREWEEVNVLAPGTRKASFGWAVMEGEGCFEGRECDPQAHIAPAVTYPHVEGDTSHCGIIGGSAYRGEAGSLPKGAYLYADYCSGTIWAVPAEQLQRGRTAPAVVGQVPSELGQVRSFGEDDGGELYLLTSAGHVAHIRST